MEEWAKCRQLPWFKRSRCFIRALGLIPSQYKECGCKLISSVFPRLKPLLQSLGKCIDGNWGPWGPWSSCDSKTGMKKRTRKCDSPAPSKGGQPCPGSSTEEASCAGHSSSLRPCTAV